MLLEGPLQAAAHCRFQYLLWFLITRHRLSCWGAADLTLSDVANHCGTIKLGHTATEGGVKSNISAEENLDAFSVSKDSGSFAVYALICSFEVMPM